MDHLPTIITFSDCSHHTPQVVGEKGVDLGQLENVQLPIPPGFVIPSHILSSLLTQDLQAEIESVFKRIEGKHPETLKFASETIQRLIERIEIPEEVAREIATAYHALGKDAFVAVRSSKSSSRLPTIHDTFLNIQGDANVIETIKKCWAKLYQPKVLLSVFENLISPTQISQAVVIQRMTQSKTAGVAYSKNPDNNNKRTVIIDAVWGLGEYLMDHLIQADRYEVEKDTWEVVTQNRHAQDKEFVRKMANTEETKVPENRKFAPKLSNDEIRKLAQLAVKVQQFLFFPQRIEWSLEGDQFFILQTEQLVEQITDTDHGLITQVGTMRPILYGSSVQQGLISGKARICLSDQEYLKLEPGEILVTKKLGMLNLEKVRKVAGIVADEAIFPRDVHSLGIPCIGNTHFGTHVLQTGQQITIYGQQGAVYDGALEYSTNITEKQTEKSFHTEVYLSTGEPDAINQVERKDIAGVGLLRTEYLFAELGLHPKYAIRNRKEHQLIQHLHEGIKKVCKAVHPKPVLYRCLDMTSTDLHKLEGGKEYEPAENNPMIGYRGGLRYLTDLSSFDLELTAIKELKREGFDNLHIMFPFVRSLEEFILLKSHLEKHGLKQSHHFQLWMMIDTPAVALTLDQFFSHGLDGVTIGSKDLHMLLLGQDPQVATAFSSSYENSAVFKQVLKQILDSAQKFDKKVIFCEQSLNQDLIEFLVQNHIHGISVNAKQVPFVRKMLKK